MAGDDFFDDGWIEEILTSPTGQRNLTFKTSVRKDARNDGFKKFIEEAMKRPYITVGFHQDAGSEPDGTTIVEVAFWNEFGTVTKEGHEHIPERSFMRSTLDDNKQAYFEFLEKLIAQIYAGDMDLEQAMNVFGLKVETDIKGRITAIQFPPNAPRTIEKKGSSKPLIDKGAMRAAVRYVVHMGGEQS